MSASTEKKNRQAARAAGIDKKQLAALEEEKRLARSKRRWTFGSVAVALLIAAIIFLDSGFLYKHTTAVTVGDTSYTPAEMNYQYSGQYVSFLNQYGSYAGLFGLDSSTGLAGLKAQSCPMLENGTWYDYFSDAAVNQLVQIKAVCDYAAANGIVLSEDELNAVDAEFAALGDYAKSMGYSSAKNFLAANYGTGVDERIAVQAAYDSNLASKAITAYNDALSYSADEIAAQYESYNGDMDYFDIAYYLVSAEKVAGEDGTEAATDETRAEAEKTADAIMAAYKELDDENDVAARLNAALAEAGIDAESTHSESLQGAGLGAAYKDWVMGARKTGDISVCADESGDSLYVVAYIGREDNNYKLAQVRHILVKAVADENGEYTDEAKAEALAKAEDILAEWEAGEATEESFAALAEQYSEDAGSNTNGGLYDSVQKGQMVDEFDKFCFEGHKSGDTGIVYGETGSYAGYHVMYYVGEGQLCKDAIAESDLRDADLAAWLEELTAAYEPVKGFWYRLVG